MPFNVLIIRLSAIGDVVHALPLASQIKQIAPGARITWVVEPAASDLVLNNPAIDRVLVFSSKAVLTQIKTLKFGKPQWQGLSGFFHELRADHYDAAIDAQGLFKSAILTYMSGAKVRIGFAGAREFGDRFLTHRVNVGDYFGPERSVVKLNLELAKEFARIYKLAQLSEASEPTFVLPALPEEAKAKASLWLQELQAQGHEAVAPKPEAAAGAPGVRADLAPDAPLAPKTPLTPQATSIPAVGASPQTAPVPRAAARPSPSLVPGTASLASAGTTPAIEPHLYINRWDGTDKFAVLVPGTTWDSKIWPLHHWQRLAEKMADELHLNLVLVGGKRESETNAELAKHLRQSGRPGVIDLTEKTSLLELQALFQLSQLVVGADTGPLHLAAATGVPTVVGVFGSTPAGRNGPYGQQCLTVNLGLDCQPCFEKICPLSTKACLVDMSPDFVFARLVDFIEKREP